MAGFCEEVMNLRFPYESRIVFDKLGDYQLFKQCHAPWNN
jgi:hypothetical protein